MDRARNPSWLPGQVARPVVAAGSTLLRVLTRSRRQMSAAMRATAAAAIAPHSVIVLLILAGAAMGISGVYLMLGLGPALLAGCGVAFATAGLIAKGANG